MCEFQENGLEDNRWSDESASLHNFWKFGGGFVVTVSGLLVLGEGSTSIIKDVAGIVIGGLGIWLMHSGSKAIDAEIDEIEAQRAAQDPDQN